MTGAVTGHRIMGTMGPWDAQMAPVKKFAEMKILKARMENVTVSVTGLWYN